jgi:Actin
MRSMIWSCSCLCITWPCELHHVCQARVTLGTDRTTAACPQAGGRHVNLDDVAAAVSVLDADLTGLVVDVGEGAAAAVPIISGYVVVSAIRSVPLAGADATAWLVASLRERGQALPPEGALEFCRCASGMQFAWWHGPRQAALQSLLVEVFEMVHAHIATLHVASLCLC